MEVKYLRLKMEEEENQIFISRLFRNLLNIVENKFFMFHDMFVDSPTPSTSPI